MGVLGSRAHVPGAVDSGRVGASCRTILVASVAVVLVSSCVERRLRIHSEPAGADVYVNGRFAGQTPLEHSFEHYGTYQLDVWRSGHQSLSTKVEVEAPWWQLPPFDLFAELDPRGLVDEHHVELELEPREAGAGPGEHTDLRPQEELARERARELQARASELRGGAP